MFEHELRRALYPNAMVVHAAGPMRPLSEIVASVRAVPEVKEILFLRMPFGPDEPFEVSVGALRPDDAGALPTMLLVDPYTAEVLGPRPGAVLDWLFELHTALFAGATGRTVVGVLGLTLLASCVSGVVLWWPRSVRALRRAVTISRETRWPRRWFEIHNVVGAYAGALVAVLALTGSGIVFRDQVSRVAAHLGAAPFNPVVPFSTQPVEPTADASLDAMLEAARRALPGARVTYVSFPRSAEARYQVRLKLPDEVHQNGRSYVWFDRYDGRVLRVRNALELPNANRVLDDLLYPLHTGVVLGLWGRALVLLVGLVPAAFLLSGLMIWRAKRRARAM